MERRSVDLPRAPPIIGGVERIDVLIVTAVPEEYAAVLTVSDGGLGTWTEQKGSTGLIVAVRDFSAGGGTLAIGAPEGGVVVATTNVGHLSRLVTAEVWPQVR